MSQLDDLIGYLRSKLGKPYTLGAVGPDEFDCSGLVYCAFKEVLNIEIPRVSSDQSGAGKKINEVDLKKGDIVFFDTGWSDRKPNHLGVYIGEGNMINANSYYGDVHEEKYNSGYWQSKIWGFRRIIDVESPFKDMNVEDEYFSYVLDLFDRGVVDGYPKLEGDLKPEFKPYGDINRAEMLKLLLLSFSIPIPETGSVSFSDVKNDDWFYKYVLAAFNEGIIDGYPDGSFKPGNNVNRVEALKMLLEASDVDLSSTNPLDFDDVNDQDWYYKYVCYSMGKYLISPMSEKYFGCKENLSRGEACMIISKLL